MNRSVLFVAATAAALSATPCVAEEYGSAKEAEAMVKNAVSHIKKVGKDQAYADFTAKKAPFFDRDLYVVVYGLDGKVHAHGQNAKMVGRDMIDLKDSDGKLFVKERAELGKSKGNFWQDYKFTDPVSRKVLPKQMYCERNDDAVVCTGIYKRT